MEIIVVDPTYDREDRDREKFINDLQTDAQSLSSDLQISDTDIGRGADWPAIFLSIGGLFFLGKKINENLEAWVSLARKFIKFIENLRKKSWKFRIDEIGATLLAIERIIILEQGNISSIEKISENIVAISPFTGREPEGLRRRPDCLYMQIFKVNDNTVYIFGIKSKGSVEIEYKINTADWMTF